MKLADSQIGVDVLRPCRVNARWRWPESCHLVCLPGQEEVLHRFAGYIGMKRAWFQPRGGVMPHYDLNAARRIVAVKRGAVELTNYELVDLLKIWREHAGK